MDTNYKRTVAGSVGAGLGAIFNASGRTYYILEHKTNSKYHQAGESQKIIVDQVEMGRDSSCQVRFDESFETVSRKHAAIVRDGSNWKLVPLSSTNATLVNGQPITGERVLNSGDEIRLSSQGPVLGFILPQGAQSLVKSIGLTERMNLFRKQALRPYKTAIWCLFAVLIIAVGALVAWNLYQAKNYEQKLADMQFEQELIADEMMAKDAEISALKGKINNAEARARMTAEEVRKANETLEKYEAEKADLAKKQQAIEASIVELNKKAEAPQPAKAAEKAASKAAEKAAPAAKAEPAAKPADIKDCYNSVYYVKMDDVSVYDKDNKELVKFTTDYLVGGTGFLLDNGRFVTARRVVEPWFYYSASTSLGKDRRGVSWTFADIQAAQSKEGFKVVANYTAYAPNGMNFKFKNTDIRGDKAFESTDTYYTIETYKLNNTLYRLFRTQEIKLKRYNKATRADWVSMAKADQLQSGNGLAFDAAYSLSPVSGTEVTILGYPLGAGMKNSESVNPDKRINNINVTGLNDQGVIELSSRRYTEGNDGAPVLMNKDGKWVVIGILSHTDSADRDVVVPISYTK
jgi:pSer/pThr/pTyr-binding forkhead associated (FHA) protein